MDLNTATQHLESWAFSDIQNFWGHIASTDHLVQIYENDNVLMNTLEGFVGDGFIRDQCAIIIATPEHLQNLDERLARQGFNDEELKATSQFITATVEDALQAIMVNNKLDKILFESFVAGLMNKAAACNKKIRVYGEIVGELWRNGLHDATIQLEKMWHTLQQKNSFCLFCAYPQRDFKHDDHRSINMICNTHSKVIDGSARPSTEIYYMDAGKHHSKPVS